jgi:small subunit ribosomal protein S6
MVSQENKQLHDYELVVIINPEVVSEGANSVTEGVSRFITENGGTVSAVEPWGKRKLAYPIKNFMEGSYVLTRFKIQPKLTKQLEVSLQISEDVLRHLLIKVD